MDIENVYRKLVAERENQSEYKGIIRGTCDSFCPYFEYIERRLRNDVNIYEKDVMVKKYYRSSAGKTKAFPEDIRHIGSLRKATDYLLNLCYADYSLELYKFVENRTRAIRLDISVQDLKCDDTIYIYESISRFHIVYSYVLYDVKEFESHLNIDQLKKTLSTLYSLYQERKRNKKNKSIVSKNEIEFISYYILLCLDDKHLFLNRYFRFQKIRQSLRIRQVYQQNNIYGFFNEARRSDTLSFFIMHLFYNKFRIKSMEIFNKCLVEKIDKSFFNSMLHTNDKELLSLLDKTNVSINEDKVNFKNKDMIENDNVLFKERKESIGLNCPSVLIFLGNIDYKIYVYLLGEYICKYIRSRDPFKGCKINLKNKYNESVPCRGFVRKASLGFDDDDVFKYLLERYSKDWSQRMYHKLQTHINRNNKKNELSKSLCFLILEDYLKGYSLKTLQYLILRAAVVQKLTYWKNKAIGGDKMVEVKEKRDLLIIVTNNSIFNEIFKKNVSESCLMKHNPVFINIKEANLDNLMSYDASVFSLNKNEIKEAEDKFFMLNRIVDTPQNLSKKLEGIDQLVRRSSKIIRNDLNSLLRNKDVNSKTLIVTKLIENKRNAKILEDVLISLHNNKKIENIDVFYEQGEL